MSKSFFKNSSFHLISLVRVICKLLCIYPRSAQSRIPGLCNNVSVISLRYRIVFYRDHLRMQKGVSPRRPGDILRLTCIYPEDIDSSHLHIPGISWTHVCAASVSTFSEIFSFYTCFLSPLKFAKDSRSEIPDSAKRIIVLRFSAVSNFVVVNSPTLFS